MKTLLSALSILVLATACNMKDSNTELKQKQQEANKEFNDEVKDASQERSKEFKDASKEYGEEQKEEAEDYLESGEGATIDKDSDTIHVDEPEDVNR
jgi:F0F1-type ATP synthase membrane subunit b/b'